MQSRWCVKTFFKADCIGNDLGYFSFFTSVGPWPIRWARVKLLNDLGCNWVEDLSLVY